MRRLTPTVLAVFAVTIFIALTDGGRQARQAIPPASYIDQILERMGLGLSEVIVKGQKMTRDGEIYDQLRLNAHRSIWLFDTESARRRVETLPWILKASVKRVFPDRLDIEVLERRPTAVWNDGRRSVLIDATGRVLGPAGGDKKSKFPTFYGAGAAAQASSILESVDKIADLRHRIGLFEWVANRRWTLHLKSGRQILLPAKDIRSALLRLVPKSGARLLDTDFEKLDLRLDDQLAVELRK